jgi:predicted nucleotidyltransferase
MMTPVVSWALAGQTIRYASAPSFLALKWSAFLDRGMTDPYASHDLEDIVALVASRPEIERELAQTLHEIATFVRDCTAQFLTMEMADDVVSGALANVADAKVVAEVRRRLRGIASLRL